MLRLIVLVVFALLTLSNTWAQSLSGIVVDAESREPLEGALVKVLESDLFSITDERGAFSFQELNESHRVLEISFVGFKTQRIDMKGRSSLEIALNTNLLLEEVVIKALRAPEGSPTAQKTLPRENIQKVYWGQDAVLNLERIVPSILAHSESGSGFANYALMRLRGIDQTRINITLNGVPLNDMVDQGVFFSNFTDFSNNIQSVQVQRGVGTSTNGTASYAGSINYETSAINQENSSGELQLTAGSFGSFRGSVGFKSGLINDRWAFGARITKTYSDGYKFNSGTNAESFFFSGGYFGEKDIVKINVLAGRTRNELAYLPVLIDDIREEPRTNYLDPNDEDDFNQQLAQLQHIHAFNNKWSLASSLYYGGAGGDFPFGFDDGNGNLIQQNFPLYNDHFGALTALSGVTREGWEVNAGLHGYVFKRKNQEGFLDDKNNPYYSDHTQKNELSAFGKAQRQWGNWKFFADLQIRRVTLDLEPDLTFLESQGVNISGLTVPQRDWTFFNPKVGITYQLNGPISLFWSFGRSGREPTRADILGSTVVSAFNLDAVLDENSVKAEYVNDMELGLNISTSKLQAQANFFYMDFSDEIAPTGEFIPEGFVQLRQNIADSYRTGLEIDWLWQPLDDLAIGGQATFMQSEIKAFAPGGATEIFRNVEPILSPEWLINAHADYKVNQYFSVGLSARYVGESFLELTNRADLTMPDFMVLNAQLGVNWKAHQLVVQVNNLFDTQYFTNGAPVDVDFDGTIDGPGYLVQAPASVFATLKLSF